MKKVACLYRVSTKGQVDENDIPMQRKACRDFIEQKLDWKLHKEYYEKGVSGFKVSAQNRDELKRLREDAQQGKFDVLLVFMYDRLGRKDDETPFIVEWFANQGIEVWSTMEGQQKFEHHVDKLLNYIRFWQSSGESIKISQRVSTKHYQMVKSGLFRGGQAPFGYKLVKSGEKDKKGRELCMLAIDEDESAVVKTIFEMASMGYGSRKIATKLNEALIRTRKGSPWQQSVVRYLLNNLTYKGYFSCKTKDGEMIQSNKLPELVIVSDEVWDKAMKIRKLRDNNSYGPISKGLPLVGIIRCGHCDSTMHTYYSHKKYWLKNGKVKKYVIPKYRCTSASSKRLICDGQRVYSQSKIEETVFGEIYEYLDRLKKIDLTDLVKKTRDSSLIKEHKEQKRLDDKIKDIDTEIEALSNEIPKAIMNKSSFSAAKLSELINKKESERNCLLESLEQVEESITEKEREIGSVEHKKSIIPNWKKLFIESDIDNKKVLLREFIEEVRVYRTKVEIDFKISIDDFLTGEIG